MPNDKPVPSGRECAIRGEKQQDQKTPERYNSKGAISSLKTVNEQIK